jgi:inorganic pyrophosphatase/exopolyphosphatase
MPERSDKLVLKDRNGHYLEAKKVAGILEIVVEDVEAASFDMTATHVGKLLEFVVDQFFPKGTEIDFGTQDKLDIRPE